MTNVRYLGRCFRRSEPVGGQKRPIAREPHFVPRQTREMDIAGFDESGEGFGAPDTLSAPAKLFGLWFAEFDVVEYPWTL